MQRNSLLEKARTQLMSKHRRMSEVMLALLSFCWQFNCLAVIKRKSCIFPNSACQNTTFKCWEYFSPITLLSAGNELLRLWLTVEVSTCLLISWVLFLHFRRINHSFWVQELLYTLFTSNTTKISSAYYYLSVAFHSLKFIYST